MDVGDCSVYTLVERQHAITRRLSHTSESEYAPGKGNNIGVLPKTCETRVHACLSCKLRNHNTWFLRFKVGETERLH